MHTTNFTPAQQRGSTVRLLVPSLLAVAVVGLGGLNLAVHQQLSDASALLGSTQSDLSTTQARLNSTQGELSDTRDARAALQTQVDGLNANMAQLSAERDGLKADLDKAKADVDKLNGQLQDTRKSLDSASARLDTAQRGVAQLGQVSLMLADVMSAYSDYDQLVDLQLHDVLAANNAAVAFDWTSQRIHINAYNDRLSQQGQKAERVRQALQKLSAYVGPTTTTPSPTI